MLACTWAYLKRLTHDCSALVLTSAGGTTAAAQDSQHQPTTGCLNLPRSSFSPLRRRRGHTYSGHDSAEMFRRYSAARCRLESVRKLSRLVKRMRCLVPPRRAMPSIVSRTHELSSRSHVAKSPAFTARLARALAMTPQPGRLRPSPQASDHGARPYPTSGPQFGCRDHEVTTVGLDVASHNPCSASHEVSQCARWMNHNAR